MLAERWRAAVMFAEQQLSKPDYDAIRNFDSDEALMEDLYKKQRELTANSWVSGAAYDVLPAVKALSDTACVFVLAMSPPVAIKEVAIIWGLVHLTMKLSLETKSKWDDFVERFERIRESLVVLTRTVELCEVPSEAIGIAVFNVFSSLIGFWVEAVRWMRRYPLENSWVPKIFPKLKDKFDEAITKVERAIQHLKDISKLNQQSRQSLEREQQKRHADMVSQIQTSDDRVVYPVMLVPRAAHTAAFYGRQDSFDEIDQILQSPSTELRSVLITGLGGVGKTQTALNYAHSRAHKYDAIFWARSESSSSLAASFTNIARGLNLPGSRAEGQEEQNLLSFQSWLRSQAARQNGRRWLLIFDNVENIEDISPKYMPTTGGSVLMTSRRPTVLLSDTVAVSLKPFSKEDGKSLLKQLLKKPTQQLPTQTDEDALGTLAERVGGLPLGLRVVGGLMNQRLTTPASAFLTRYTKHTRKLIAQAQRIVDYDGDEKRILGEEHILDNVWRMSFEGLDQEARTLLGIISLLSPDGIDSTLFGASAAEDAPLQDMLCICGEDDFGLDRAIVELVNAGLIDVDGPVISVHRLVQDAFIHNCNASQLEDHFTGAVHIIYQSFPHQVNGRPMHEVWGQCRELIQHGRWLAERYVEAQSFEGFTSTPLKLTELLKSCAWYLFEMSDHRSAISLLSTALDACPDTTSELHAHLLNTKGCCFFELNDLEPCRAAWEVALSIRKSWSKKKAPGAEEELANQLSNFGNLESAVGHLDSALRYFAEAKDIRMRLGEGTIVPLGVTHMCTGRAYFLKQMYDKAEAEYDQARDIFIAKFGPNAHFMTHLHYAYGNLQYARGDYNAAEKSYTSARKILETDTPYHVLLTACYYKIACLLLIKNQRDEALSLLDKALTIAEFREAKGDVARIVRKKAAIFQRGTDREKQNAKLLLSQVGLMLIDLPVKTSADVDDAEEAWNSWVCPYWR